MIKIIKIQSKKDYLSDTKENILFGVYSYKPASVAVKAFTMAVRNFNERVDPKLMIQIAIKYTDEEYAKIKLIGKKESIHAFINDLIVDTSILEFFDVRL